MASQKKRKSLSLERKIEILRAVDSGRKKSDVAKEFELSSSTMSTIIKNKCRIEEQYESAKYNPSHKRFRTAALDDVEEALIKWFRDVRDKNLPVSGPLLKEKVEFFATSLGHEFKASNGWLARFKERHNIHQLQVCGDSAGVDEVTVDAWRTESLPTIVKDYDQHDIYNADETGLFYRMTPDKTLAFSGTECHGTKQNKDRVNVMLCANMSGTEKLKPLVIGKAKKPRSLKNVRSLPVSNTANKKAWMVSEEFTAWVKQLDRRFAAEGRRVLLFIDNCSAHPNVDGLQAVKLQFFPPNTTSHLQPMDQGVIMSFKTHYRQRLVKRLLQSYEAGDSPDPITIKDAIDLIHASWQQVTELCIQHCYTKAGFKLTEEARQEPDIDVDVPGPSSRLDNIWERIGHTALETTPHDVDSGDQSDETFRDDRNICRRLGRHMQLPSSFQEYTMADHNVKCSVTPKEEELVDEVKAARTPLEQTGQTEEDDEEDEIPPPPPPTAADALSGCRETPCPASRSFSTARKRQPRTSSSGLPAWRSLCRSVVTSPSSSRR
ncbi:tigger transposable element-derived protein 4-like [Diadema setosum]|uniref:tigger transposable element-derived protein 4-like n=1 Tax=Diadema setosum TaxID=31175 RepID=UPI003B3B6B7D